MVIKIRLVLIMMFGCSIGLFSQTQKIEPLYPTVELMSTGISPEKSDVEITKELYNELEGTFHVEISQVDYNIVYTRELMEMIKSSRIVGQTVYLNWDQYTTIIIDPLPNVENSATQIK